MSAAGNAQLVLVDENHTRAPMPPLKRKVTGGGGPMTNERMVINCYGPLSVFLIAVKLHSELCIVKPTYCIEKKKGEDLLDTPCIPAH